MNPKVLRRRALRIDQVPDHPLYLFALRAREIFQIADVSRISRDEAGSLIGYHREQVRKHVEGIEVVIQNRDLYRPTLERRPSEPCQTNDCRADPFALAGRDLDKAIGGGIFPCRRPRAGMRRGRRERRRDG